MKIYTQKFQTNEIKISGFYLLSLFFILRFNEQIRFEFQFSSSKPQQIHSQLYGYKAVVTSFIWVHSLQFTVSQVSSQSVFFYTLWYLVFGLEFESNIAVSVWDSVLMKKMMRAKESKTEYTQFTTR